MGRKESTPPRAACRAEVGPHGPSRGAFSRVGSFQSPESDPRGCCRRAGRPCRSRLGRDRRGAPAGRRLASSLTGRPVPLVALAALAMIVSCSTGPAGGKGPGPSARPGARIPEDFLWGVSTSAYQTEGNNTRCDYDQWNRAGHGAELNGMAANSYELFDLDSELARAIGVGVFRMGIEWSRVEPEKGRFDSAELQHYRAVLESIRSRGMRPFVTLHHFTNPLWVAQQGWWLAPEVIEDFAGYARRMAEEYGDIVDDWITFNEPAIYATGTYWAKLYPGGSLLNMEKATTALRHMIYAHAAAYDAIHAADRIDAYGTGRPCRVGFVEASYPTHAADAASEEDVAAAGRFDSFFNLQIYDALVYGSLEPWLEPRRQVSGGSPGGHQATEQPPHPELAGRTDYVGINYYSPLYVRSFPGILPPLEAAPCYAPIEFLCFRHGRPDVVRGDNGNEVSPEGLLEVIEKYAPYGLPLIVTENGIATTDGRMRSWFILGHIEQIEKALAMGYRVEGYFHWSLIDNFEWLSGYSMRFGLYRVDFETFERTPTEAVQAYREIIESRGVTEALKAKYTWP
jgi:beta-glucosidase